MKIEYYKEYSHELNRDMEFKVFGHAGKPCLVFPSQDGRFFDYEDMGMIEAAREYIEQGRIQFFCCDSIDQETWSKQDGDPRERIVQHERWYHYITCELVPRIYEISSSHEAIMTTGCSMGGYHAVNFFLRQPDLFDKVLSLSGIFHSDFFFHGYHDELTYQNSPNEYLAQTDPQHPYMELYRRAQIILCCGQGAWEEDMIDSLHHLEQILKEKQIDAWVDFWGYDVSHDWCWWTKQLPYFLNVMV